MPHGSGQMIRQSLMYAKPWQRYVIAGVMIAGGAVLVVLGHVAGALLAPAGALLIWYMLRYRMRSGYGVRHGENAADSDRAGEVPDHSRVIDVGACKRDLVHPLPAITDRRLSSWNVVYRTPGLCGQDGTPNE